MLNSDTLFIIAIITFILYITIIWGCSKMYNNQNEIPTVRGVLSNNIVVSELPYVPELPTD